MIYLLGFGESSGLYRVDFGDIRSKTESTDKKTKHHIATDRRLPEEESKGLVAKRSSHCLDTPSLR